MDTRTLRRRAAAATLAAGCLLTPVLVAGPASAVSDATRIVGVPTAAPSNVTAPSLVFANGRQAAVGDLVTADPGTWDTDGVTFAYQWLLDGAAVAGATTAGYTPSLGDLGKALAVSVTASAGGDASAPATSATSTVDQGDIHFLTLPVVTGEAKAGSTLTADPGTWDVANATADYQWYAGGDAVEGATGLTYTVRAGDVGDGVYMSVFLSAPDYYFSGAFTDEVLVERGTLTNEAAPKIVGAPVVGKTLTVAPGTWSATDGVALTYGWTIGGLPVAGATSPRFTVPASAVGKKIAVVESAGGSAWVPASQGSSSVTALKAPAKVVLKLAAPAKGKLKATVVVTSTVATTGKVTLKIGTVKRVVTLKSGKAVVTVAKLKKGLTRVTASYAGATGVAGAKDVASIRVK